MYVFTDLLAFLCSHIICPLPISIFNKQDNELCPRKKVESHDFISDSLLTTHKTNTWFFLFVYICYYNYKSIKIEVEIKMMMAVTSQEPTGGIWDACTYVTTI